MNEIKYPHASIDEMKAENAATRSDRIKRPQPVAPGVESQMKRGHLFLEDYKRIITWVLLVTVAVAVIMTLRPRETVFIPDGLSLLFWHPEIRCARCEKMERLIQQVLQDHPEFQLIRLEYDVFANQSLAWEFNVGTATIILVERKEGQNVRVRNLTTEVWATIGDSDEFIEMLQEELELFLNIIQNNIAQTAQFMQSSHSINPQPDRQY